MRSCSAACSRVLFCSSRSKVFASVMATAQPNADILLCSPGVLGNPELGPKSQKPHYCSARMSSDAGVALLGVVYCSNDIFSLNRIWHKACD